ncbi:MAG: pilus assembly protein TadG-related protein, partial [Candidatus Sericytochromatia bacterium]
MARRRHRPGNVLVLVTLAATALLGAGATVVDLGVGYSERARLQAAADAGAQAAARHLPPPANVAAAKAAAVEWAAKNGAATPIANVSVWDRPGGGKAVTVRCQTTVATGLARIFGIQQIPVSATASVAVAPVNEMPKGWVPFAVPAYREKYVGPSRGPLHGLLGLGDPHGGPDDWFVMSSAAGGYALLTAEPSRGGPTRLVLKSDDGHGGNFQALAIGGTLGGIGLISLGGGQGVTVTPAALGLGLT